MLVEAKSNLAKLMASENIYVEQRKVETAYFDLKNRILTVPMLDGNLSSELYDLLLGHEVGHALETPEKGWHDSVIDLKVNKSILNVCEDVRIEKKIKRKFPGIRISFLKGYKELMEMDFFGIKDKNLKELNFIDRINLHTKCGATLGIEFTNDELTILQEVECTETFDEVVTVAKKIQNLMKDEIEKLKQQQEQEGAKDAPKKLTIVLKDDDGEEKGPGEKLDPSDYDEVEIIDERTEKGEESEESGDATSEQDDGEGGKDKVKSAGKLGGTGYEESITDKSFREKEKNLHQSGKDIAYSNIPEMILDNVIVDYKSLYHKMDAVTSAPNVYGIKTNMPKMRENFTKFSKESSKVVSYLVKEFELRKNADQQARASVSKTGVLNMSRLHDYKFTDDIFRRMTKVPNGKSHGLVMYIDWSGSMADYINATVKQLLNLTMFCRKVNIPFEVYAFTSRNKSVFTGRETWEKRNTLDIQTPKVGDLVLGELTLFNLFSSKMNNKEFTHAASYLLDFGTGNVKHGTCMNYLPPDFLQLSGTPLNETIIAAFRMVQQFKTSNRLEIVNTVFLTDGEGSVLNERFSQRDHTGRFRKAYEGTTTSNTRAIYRDPVTRSICEVGTADGFTGYSNKQSEALLKLLKQRLDCNIIGFFLCSSRDVKQVSRMYTKNYSAIEKNVSEFQKNNFTIIEDSGYDEYYLIRSDKLNTEDGVFEVSSNTTRGLVSSFTKYNGNKISSRIVLNRFINLIT